MIWAWTLKRTSRPVVSLATRTVGVHNTASSPRERPGGVRFVGGRHMRRRAKTFQMLSICNIAERPPETPVSSENAEDRQALVDNLAVNVCRGQLTRAEALRRLSAAGEEWRPSMGAYEVSNFGRVRRGRRILKERHTPRGYRIVDISRDGRCVTKTVHRLIALAFLGPALGRQVSHLDGDKTNNHITNLEWATASENMRHRYALAAARAAGVSP